MKRLLLELKRRGDAKKGASVSTGKRVNIERSRKCILDTQIRVGEMIRATLFKAYFEKGKFFTYVVLYEVQGALKVTFRLFLVEGMNGQKDLVQVKENYTFRTESEAGVGFSRKCAELRRRRYREV